MVSKGDQVSFEMEWDVDRKQATVVGEVVSVDGSEVTVEVQDFDSDHSMEDCPRVENGRVSNVDESHVD